jgi:prepilin-type N-terminal cleavage/methylation domain-containing protein
MPKGFNFGRKIILKQNEGFTLIELLVTIAIIAVVLA